MMRHGITATTVEEFLIGPGAVYRNFVNPDSPGTLVGATIGGNSVRIEREWYTPEIDGALGPLKGARRLVRELPAVTVRLTEVTKENLMLALSGTQAEDYPATEGKTHDRITSKGKIDSTDYLTNVAIIGDKGGTTSPIVFVVKNALSTEPVEVPLGTGRDDVVLAVTFSGHYDPASPNVPPYEILSPV
jgi:hypothetical protein